jgi:hypothetical protein
MVLTLTPAGYQEQIYRGTDKLQFQDIELNLTADEIISAGRSYTLRSVEVDRSHCYYIADKG